jgi:predicted RNase H-like HicB family nuclease
MIKVVIEKASKGYTAYVPELPGCTSYGRTISEIQQNIKEAIFFHVKGLKEDGIKIPSTFRGRIVFTYKNEIADLFCNYPIINVSAFATRIGMNKNLLSQYINCIKAPSEKQAKKVLCELKKVGNEISKIKVKNV